MSEENLTEKHVIKKSTVPSVKCDLESIGKQLEEVNDKSFEIAQSVASAQKCIKELEKHMAFINLVFVNREKEKKK